MYTFRAVQGELIRQIEECDCHDDLSSVLKEAHDFYGSDTTNGALPLSQGSATAAFTEECAACALGHRQRLSAFSLSRQEQRCLQFLVSAQSPKEIAHAMDLSTSTVRMHLRSVRKRLEAKTLIEAVAKAVQLRIVTHSSAKTTPIDAASDQ